MSNIIELKKKAEELEAELQKLKEELVHGQGEPEIPDFPVFNANGETSWWSNNSLEVTNRGFTSGHVADYNYFHTEEYADEFAKNCKLIAMMMHCKWNIDRAYEPDWSKGATKKWFVCFNYQSGEFVPDYEFTVRRGQVYFSSEKTAQKCADWMNTHWHD